VVNHATKTRELVSVQQKGAEKADRKNTTHH
jgi:hypothetical protein